MSERTYKQMIEKMRIKLAWKRLAMPRAKQRTIHSTPVLPEQHVSKVSKAV